mmetsp:Transcript_50822/g.132184  ORF Transcript_50822/g.132184 Transcript_50822/m.132184 type:complete len:253 (-) Transcript_50822:673-1431(-)
MLIVARWSMTDCWYSAFSALRCSPASFKLTSMSATSFLSVSMSLARDASLSVRAKCLSSNVSLVFVCTLIRSSVSSISFLQNSCFSYSSCCCFLSSAVILSIISITFVKESSRTRTASDSIAQFLWALATFAIRSIARWDASSCADEAARRLLLSAVSCSRLSVDLENVARASSSVRIFRASDRARSSSLRTAKRFLYSSSSFWQPSRICARKVSSASLAAAISSLCSFACAIACRSSASSTSFLFLVSVAM